MLYSLQHQLSQSCFWRVTEFSCSPKWDINNFCKSSRNAQKCREHKLHKFNLKTLVQLNCYQQRSHSCLQSGIINIGYWLKAFYLFSIHRRGKDQWFFALSLLQHPIRWWYVDMIPIEGLEDKCKYKCLLQNQNPCQVKWLDELSVMYFGNIKYKRIKAMLL